MSEEKPWISNLHGNCIIVNSPFEILKIKKNRASNLFNPAPEGSTCACSEVCWANFQSVFCERIFAAVIVISWAIS
jgi:hypothetical protein